MRGFRGHMPGAVSASQVAYPGATGPTVKTALDNLAATAATTSNSLSTFIGAYSIIPIPLAASFYGTGWTVANTAAGTLRTALPNNTVYVEVADPRNANRALSIFQVVDRVGHPVTCRVYANGTLKATLASAGNGLLQVLQVNFTRTPAAIWVLSVTSGGQGGEYLWTAGELDDLPEI